MKILMFSYEYPPIGGGGGVVVSNLVNGLNKSNSIILVTSKFKNLKFHEKKENIEIYRLPVFRSKEHKARLFEMMMYVFLSFFMLIALRFRNSFDVINLHFAVPTGVIIYPIKIVYPKTKVSLVLHGGDVPNSDKKEYMKYYKYVRGLIRSIIKISDNVIAVNPEVKNNIEKICKNKNVIVIPNGVDTGKFYPNNSKKEYDLLFMGRFVFMKQPFLAVKSFEKMAKLNPRLKMLMIGDGELFDEISKYIKDKNIDGITFKKWVTHDELPEIINQCKVFLSVQKSTNFGSLSLLECMACGLPIIATDVGNTKSFIKDAGVFVSSNEEVIAKETLKLLSNQKTITSKSEKSLTISNEFSMDSMIRKYLEVFSSK